MSKVFVFVLGLAFCTMVYDTCTDGPVWKGIKDMAPKQKAVVKEEKPVVKQTEPVKETVYVVPQTSPRCNGDTSYASIMNDNKRMYAESIKMSAELNAARQEVQRLRASLDYYNRRER